MKIQPKISNGVKVPIEVSAHHIHLDKKDLGILFGKNYELEVLNHLSQNDQFAAKETVTLANDKFKLENVRILGPLRKKTQVEICQTEARMFGISPSVRNSSDLEKSTGGLEIIGPKGKIKLNNGIIIPLRHIHASFTEAVKYKVKNGQLVSVKVGGERGLTFHNVLVRVDPSFVWNMHIDTDEANAAGLKGGEQGELII